ncbi:MAG TPA: polymerase basic protein 2 [Candidatus Moranbacteria bacterium]|nr:polymerase basic protein 2 [Candidatus Moranbacteria bacterium]
MVEFIQKIWLLLIDFLQNLHDFVSPFLQRLDPALFQNIILGVLAIFIPFAIVFLTDVLDLTKEKRREFEKIVLNDEVLGRKFNKGP